MRPVQLTLDGFASFREATMIDFGEADYFALVGPTGSGKSTILDAMIFALYGTVPRWGKKNAIADALAPTTNRCTVSLIFDVTGQRYQVAREVRRTGATPQQRNVSLVRFHDPAALVADLDTCDVIAAEIKELQDAVVAILGLSYDNFCQSVVLPQGQFAQFMTAPARDRQRILLTLLGADHYDQIGREAGIRAEASKQHVIALTGQQEQLSDATDDALSKLTDRQDLLSQVEADIAAELPQIAWLDRTIAERDAQIESLRQQLRLVTAVAVPDGIAELHDHLTRARAAVAAADQRHGSASVNYRDAVREAESSPSQDAVRRWSGLYDDRARITADLAAVQLAAAEAQQARLAADDTLGSARQHLTDADDTVRKAQTELADAQEGTRQAEARVTELAQLRAEIESLTGLAAQIARARQSAAEQDSDLSALVAAKLDAERAVEKADAALEHARTRSEAATLRPLLELGHDCPVCAQTVATLPPPLVDSDLERARTDRTAAAEALRRTAAAVTTAEEDHRSRQQDIAVSERTLDAGWARLSGVDGLPDEPDAALDWIRDLARDADSARTAAHEAMTTATTTVDAVGARHADLVGQEQEAARARETALMAEHRAEAHQQSLTAELTRTDAALADAPDHDKLPELAAEAVRLAAAKSTAEAAMTTADAERTHARADLDEASEQVRTARRTVEQTRDRLGALNPPAVDMDDLPAAWSGLMDWASTTSDELGMAIREAEVARAESAADRERTSESIHARFAAAFDDRPCPDFDQLGRQLVIEVEQARSAVTRMTERIEQRHALTAQITAAQAEHDVAAQLRTMLRSNQFPQWLADTALDSLVATASQTLRRLSNEQFDLTHDRGEFAVIDHSDADSIRSVRTLSGGETFQASLALALALADQLAGMAGAAKLESMFLDEGFGTLDPESLEIVAATLENLAGGERTVGVVTHVQALAERVPVRFQVRRDSRTSTVTREAW